MLECRLLNSLFYLIPGMVFSIGVGSNTHLGLLFCTNNKGLNLILIHASLVGTFLVCFVFAHTRSIGTIDSSMCAFFMQLNGPPTYSGTVKVMLVHEDGTKHTSCFLDETKDRQKALTKKIDPKNTNMIIE